MKTKLFETTYRYDENDNPRLIEVDEQINTWIAANPQYNITDIKVNSYYYKEMDASHSVALVIFEETIA